jgi:hypothetical protein
MLVRDVVCCLALSCPVVSCRVLSCPVVSYRVLSCPVLHYRVASCPVLSRRGTCRMAYSFLCCLIRSCAVVRLHWWFELCGRRSVGDERHSCRVAAQVTRPLLGPSRPPQTMMTSERRAPLSLAPFVACQTDGFRSVRCHLCDRGSIVYPHDVISVWSGSCSSPSLRR